MVTATFAKPTMKYDQFMEGKTELIEWSYNDQQNMKQVINKTKKQMMINSRNKEKDNSESDKKVNIEKEVIEELFNDYQTRYGEQYLSVLSSEYEKYPELVFYVNPSNEVMMEYDKETDRVYINYDEIWLKIESLFHLNYDDTKTVIRLWMEEDYNLEGITIWKGVRYTRF